MEETSVDNLVTICTRYIAKNLNKTLLTEDKTLRPKIAIPAKISESIIAFADANAFVSGNVVAAFKDTARTCLRFLRLRNSEELTDDIFEVLMTHYPISIDIHNCPKLTTQALNIINKYGQNLKEISIGNSVQIFPVNLPSFLSRGSSSHYLLATPKLCKLVIWGLNVSHDEDGEGQDYWSQLTGEFIQNLQYLDMSDCDGIENFTFLKNAKKLKSLSLYNVELKYQQNWIILKELTELRHLDIGQSPKDTRRYIEADSLLSSLVERLPNLSSLDVSATNLGGLPIEDLANQPNQDNLSDIPGLKSRVNTPLEFLGLYRTHHEASHRNRIPSKTITGNKDESQVLLAFQTYMDRPEFVEKVLTDLYHLYEEGQTTDIDRWINLILQAMKQHITERPVQFNGSACLYFIVKFQKDAICVTLKRKIITTLINSMQAHKDDAILIGHSIFTILDFKIPDIIYAKKVYEKLLSFIIEIVYSTFWLQEDFALVLMASVTKLCRLEGSRKRLGDVGAIQKLLELVQDRLDKQEDGYVMKVAWTTMWNILYINPENCEKFLNGRGIELFLQCHEKFPNNFELLRKMIGPFRDVVEVPHLRPLLITSEFTSVLYSLLDSTQGIGEMELSYTVSIVIVAILADGAETWTILSPSRQQVLDKIRRNINRWDINTGRSENFRSLRLMARMLKVYDPRECQLWAAWTLANLTRVDLGKYLPLVENENLLQYAYEILRYCPSDLGRFGKLTLDLVQAFMENQEQSSTAHTNFPNITACLLLYKNFQNVCRIMEAVRSRLHQIT